jgi:hypothetical protein
MTTHAIVLVLGALAGSSDSAADVVTLKDGTRVLGQVLNSSKQGKAVMLVRREWAEANLPGRAKAWRAAEAPWMAEARRDRLRRLEAWRDERSGGLGAGAGKDSVLQWIDAEVDRLKAAGNDRDLPPLMMAAIDRREVETIRARPAEQKRLLRQGWKAGFPDVETMPVQDLRGALEGRNFSTDDPAPVDELLPLPIESDSAWLARRAATEVGQDEGLRFVRYQGLVLPEDMLKGGQAQLDASAVTNLLGSVLGGGAAPEDAVAAKLRTIGSKGKVGAILTTLEIAPDLSGVRIESTLLVRQGAEDWRAAARKSATMNVDQIPPGEGRALGDDPQVEAAFGLVEGLGLGEVPPEAKQASLLMGAATQRAIGEARTLLQEDLQRLALPVGWRPGP